MPVCQCSRLTKLFGAKQVLLLVELLHTFLDLLMHVVRVLAVNLDDNRVSRFAIHQRRQSTAAGWVPYCVALEITDPQVYISQVQGPNSMKILEAASDDGMPEPFGYFGSARVRMGGQELVITRTGYTNELGWEFYTEPHHDADALWRHLAAKGAPHGMGLLGLDSIHIRRIEAGILNAGSDFNHLTTPFDVGLGRFVDMTKENFIGKGALQKASTAVRLTGIQCPSGEPRIGADIQIEGQPAGMVTAGAFSPFLKQGIGIALMDEGGFDRSALASISCIDGEWHDGVLAELPFYDRQAEIPRGKRVDIPQHISQDT